ncbi:MAG: hypothetical protein ACI9MC_001697, partial [Kiritimatiellia bacterium]
TNPYIETPIVDIPFDLPDLDAPIEIQDFQMSGTFAPDGSALNDVKATGLLDTRPLDKLAGQDICTLTGFLGNPCVKCGDSATECLEVELVGDKADLDKSVNVDRSYDYTKDPDCN